MLEERNSEGWEGGKENILSSMKPVSSRVLGPGRLADWGPQLKARIGSAWKTLSPFWRLISSEDMVIKGNLASF